MRSRYFATRYPNPIYEGMVRRKTELQYRTLGESQTNLNRCDLIIQRDHDCTKWIAAQTQDDQDFIDDCLRTFPKYAPGRQPTLTHLFCYGIIQVMMGRHACEAIRAIGFLPVCVQELCVSCGFP